MSARKITVVGVLASSVLAGLVACATDEDAVIENPPANTVVPTPDAGHDVEAGDDAADAGPCVDCEWFPDTCSDDVLCPNGPFGTADGLDPRIFVKVIRGRSESDVWIAGAIGSVAHFDGSSWSRSDVGVQESVHGLWLRDSAEVTLMAIDHLATRGMDSPDAGDGGTVSPDGWSSGAGPARPQRYGEFIRRLRSAWVAPGATHLWGAVESVCNPTPVPGAPIGGCLFSEPAKRSGLWRLRVTEGGGFEIREGLASADCNAAVCGDMTAVHGSSPDDIWGVGPSGTATHVTGADGDAPTFRRFNTQTWVGLRGVWSASPSEAWAVGAQGTIRHYRGHDYLWEVVDDVPTSVDLNAVWGSSPSDVWAVGDAATVLHYDGSSWSRVKIAGLEGRRPDLTSVWMSSPGHVWIGGQGVVLLLGGKP